MSYKGTPASSQIIWLEKRVEELTAAHEIATNTLKIAVEQIEMMKAQLSIRRDSIISLRSGPGGIMEMKQTIADKEKRIAELENELAGRVVWTENYGQGSEPWLNKE